MSVNLVGSVSGLGAEVTPDASNYVALKPFNPNVVGTLGFYQKSLVTGTVAAGTFSSAGDLFSFRYGGSSVCAVRRVRYTAVVLGTGFATGTVQVSMFAARSFSVSPSGGNSATLTGNFGKLRTSYATTGVVDLRIVNTAVFTPGTRTLDTDAMANQLLQIPVTANINITPQPITLWEATPADMPLLLANNEGFVVQITTPATGTFQAAVDVRWDEVGAF